MRKCTLLCSAALIVILLAGCRERRTGEGGTSVTILFTGDAKGRLWPAG